MSQARDDVREVVVEARVHGRVLVRPASHPTAPLLIGFHGYGENAEHCLEALESIPGSGDWRVAAVEALHPFYDRRRRQIVGSWMTSRLREQAIADNVRYVCDVVATLVADQAPRAMVIAGFSQGVAMAYRAAAAWVAPGGERSLDGLVILAGDVPQDVVAQSPRLPPILLGRGTEDEWYTDQKFRIDLEQLAPLDLEVESCVFEGGHLWSPAFLAHAGSFLARIAAASVVR